MPKVDDYIAQKAAVYELQQQMANWERKVTIFQNSAVVPRLGTSIANLAKVSRLRHFPCTETATSFHDILTAMTYSHQ